jgi:NAD(P)-dependent dehydrogenase (short-subunit alcohol dehydrogenase family)
MLSKPVLESGYFILRQSKSGFRIGGAMSDRVVLITGAKGGLGSFVTQRFLATGATVVGASRSIGAEDFPGPNFLALPVDFTKAAAVDRAIGSIINRYGRLDVLVHVLGGFAGGISVAETDDATWEQMRDLNLTSAFYVLRAAIPHLRKSGSGRIVAIGSLAAVEPHSGLGAYVTFKSALTSLVRTVALENKDAGLTANVVLPGTMDTPPNRKAMPTADFSKWLKPADVADLALWLADERAAHITGAAIPIDGPNT